MVARMEHDEFTLGYVVCMTCEEPKGIKQGKGKRSKFVHGRCACGPDMRTGKKAQQELTAFKPLDEVKALIAQTLIKPNKPNNAQYEPNVNGINAQSRNQTDPNTDPIGLGLVTQSQPNTNQTDVVNQPQSKPNTNLTGLGKATLSKPNVTLSTTHSQPNADLIGNQTNPNNKPNNEQSDEMSLPKCVGVGSVVGLAFGLLFNALS